MNEKGNIEENFNGEDEYGEEAKAILDLEKDKHIISTSIVFPKDILRQLGYVAVEEGVSRGEIIRRAVKEYLAKRNPPKKEDAYTKEAVEYAEKVKKLSNLIKQIRDKGYDVSISEDDFLPENIDENIAKVEKELKKHED